MAEAAVRERLWRAVLSLPPAVLRAASGFSAVHAEGGTLDPRFQLLIHLSRADATASDSPTDIPLPRPGPEPGVRQDAVVIEGAPAEIEARMLTPKGVAETAPLLVYAHPAGGGAPGLMARAAGVRVLALGYGPEQRFPAGLEAVLSAYAWARETAARAGREETPAIGGESLGGGMAAAACLELKRLGQPQPRLQLLIYPTLDMTTHAAGDPRLDDAARLTPGLRQWLDGRYIGPTDDPLDPRISPLRAYDLTRLAPALIVAAGFDPVAGQAAAYARRIRALGGDAAYRRFDSLPHGFLSFTGTVETAKAAGEAIAILAGARLRGETGLRAG